MINAAIIDDEKHSVETLKWKLDRFCPDVKLKADFTDPVKGLKFLKKERVDLLFLDIEMPKLNGFSVLEELGDIPFDVVFTTAYDEFGKKIFHDMNGQIVTQLQALSMDELRDKF